MPKSLSIQAVYIERTKLIEFEQDFFFLFLYYTWLKKGNHDFAMIVQVNRSSNNLKFP